jgi:chemotaxis protein methyltransferase CheR
MSAPPAEAPFAELALSTEDVRAIVAMVREASGIVLTDAKRELVYSRLRRRLRVLGLDSFATYRALLDRPDASEERVQMINAITTNLTGFFREAHHFAFLGDDLLPRLPRTRRRLRIWSAGCSSGEEPYTIAMTLYRAMPDLQDWDARILATDIDTDMVATAAAGRYQIQRAEAIPADLRRAHVHRIDDDTIEMGRELKSLITFRQLNLLGPWPMAGPFDIIFCRNVVIYFDKPTQRTLFDRYADLLTPDGHLFVGHSETLHNVTDRFAHVGRTIHRRIR